jgi:predicted transcriptional regulator of viral defense system
MGSSASLARLRSLGPVFRSGQAVEAGVSWRDLYRLRDEGELIELSRGLFQLAEAAGSDNADFVAVCARAPHGMVCLDSALAYWDLSDEITSEVHLAVPEGAVRPTINLPPTRVHVFNAPTFDLGRKQVRQARGEHFWISDPERSVVDAFRMRHLVGESRAYASLQRYLGRPRPKPGRLAELARELRVGGPVRDALRITQG